MAQSITPAVSLTYRLGATCAQSHTSIFQLLPIGSMVLIALLGAITAEIKSAKKERILRELEPWLAKKRSLMHELEEIADNKNMPEAEETKKLGIIMRDLASIESKITEIERA